jgi:hypothetical protein
MMDKNRLPDVLHVELSLTAEPNKDRNATFIGECFVPFK